MRSSPRRTTALAEAARPAFGKMGLWFTVGFAIVATVSGVIASVFAVSRMLAMLTEMNLVPHRHFGMPGDIQRHTLVYTIVLAMLLTVFFDLSRIAALGAVFYIVMDLVIHWGVFSGIFARRSVPVLPFSSRRWSWMSSSWLRCCGSKPNRTCSSSGLRLQAW